MQQTFTSEKISVIIPVYNAEKWLPKCMDSVLSQTYSNLEILLINDGSTDSSGSLCDTYAQEHPEIHAYHQPNQGLSAARNTGLDKALGEYLFFLDSDDFLEPSALEMLYHSLKKNNADVVIGSYQTVDTTNQPLTKENFSYPSTETIISEKEFWDFSLHHVAATIACSKLYPKKIWDNLRFPVGKIHEDNAVVHYVVKQCKKIVCLNQVVLNYRSTPDSITTTSFRLANLDKAEVLINQISYLCEKGYDSMALYYWGVGTRVILQARNKLDLSDKKVQKVIRQLYPSYKALAKQLSKSSSATKKNLIQLYLFRINLSLYHKVRELCFSDSY